MVTRVAGRSPIPREIELKLAIDPGDVPRLRKSLALDRVGPGKATRIISTYYDTPSLSLLHNAIALRLRTVGHRHVQSIKIDSDSGRYPARRAEINNAIPNGRLNLRRVEDHAVRHLIEKCCKGKKLKPIFLTNVMREIHLLELGRSHIECAIDRGFVTARGKKAKICELELELKSGEASSLLNLARRLNANTPLRIEPASKAARGYALVNGAQLVVPKANAVHLDATMSAKESLTVVMRSCLTHVIGSADYAFKSNDPEGIHQLRVAIRRTRAAFSIIRRHVAKGLDVRVARDLRSLQQKLGRAREWDVLVEETLKFAPKRLLSAPFSAHLGQIVKTKRTEGHKKAHAALQDYHCTDLLLRLAYWIDVELDSGDGRSHKRKQIADALATPATKFAAQVIQDCHRKTRKLGKKIRTLDPTQLHRLRILIKKLRYATDFFGTLWPHRRTKKYLSALKDLQQALGTFHDATVAMNLIASLAADGGADVKVGVERINDWLASEQRRKRKKLIAHWSKLARRQLFW